MFITNELDCNKKFKKLLDKISKQSVKYPSSQLPEILQIQFSHQNVAIEGYTLNEG